MTFLGLDLLVARNDLHTSLEAIDTAAKLPTTGVNPTELLYAPANAVLHELREGAVDFANYSETGADALKRKRSKLVNTAGMAMRLANHMVTLVLELITCDENRRKHGKNSGGPLGDDHFLQGLVDVCMIDRIPLWLVVATQAYINLY